MAPPARKRGRVRPTEATVARLSVPVAVPASYTAGDLYAMLVCSVLAPPAVALFLCNMALVVPPLAVVRAYMAPCFLRRPLDAVPRTPRFHGVCLLVFLLALPVMLLAVAWVAVVRLVTWTLCLPVGACHISRTRRSWRALQPYSGLPGDSGEVRKPADDLATKFGYIWPFADLVCCCIGQMDRQGFCEFLPALPFMISAIPVFKFTILTNALLYDLKETYINQWSDPLDANEDGTVSEIDEGLVQDLLKRATCRALLQAKNRELLDEWVFTGYHQFPPPGRESRTAAGFQFADQVGPLRCALISHTTHPYQIPHHAPKSEHGSWGLIVVRLQSWNPFYQLAGVVEINYRKDGGVEHPMWLVVDTSSKIAAGHLSSINWLFVELAHNLEALLRAQCRCSYRSTAPCECPA